MFMLKTMFFALCCVAYVESTEKEQNDGKETLFVKHQNIDDSKEIGKKCFSCIPGYELVASHFIKPTFDLLQDVMKCADVILDVPKFKHEKCHTDWAAVMLSVIKDRLCMLAGAPVKVKLTPQDIIDCCPQCEYKGQDLCENGGDPLAAWKFWIKFGVNLGGTLFKKASPLCLNETKGVEKCKHIKCLIEVEGDVSKLTPSDIVGQTAFLLPNNMTGIQVEIMVHGPVQCIIQVFSDLFLYKYGTVYRHKEGQLEGYSNVKVIGWGIDKATKTLYWTVVHPVWGREHGRVRFLRGENHCEIESHCIGSVYKKIGTMKKGNSSEDDDKKKDEEKKKDGDKKKTKSSANFATANYSLIFILLITYTLELLLKFGNNKA